MTLAESNAFVSMSSSADQDYPPSNILDPSDKVFWMTTGLYPQEFIITFKEPIEFRQIRFVTTNVKRFVMFTTMNTEPRNFDTILEKTLSNNENDLQINEYTLDRLTEVRHFKCVIVAGYDSFANVRVNDWPLMKDVSPTVVIGVAYVIAIVFGRKWMKSQKPFELRNFMFIYNVLQVVFCAYITYESTYVWFKERYSFLCEPVDYSSHTTAIRACKACWWYYIMKIADLIDTIIFVLRKKDNQITFLHVYHHLTMLFFAWYGAKYVGGGQSIFIASLNSFIHVVMYAYYGLSACGSHIQKYLWWKRYLTQAQIIQFVAVIGHSSINLITPCSFPKIFDISFLLYGISILLLFSNFYLQSYIKKGKHRKAA
ncbi:unnamed protein product [Rotaria sp. Silwood2]|nr:unnamed protein product [Rotaria sp. Silwood2]CAF2616279.1 unnamed protein product [Rotaria sp. Silwood2]CAF2869809.1 unnamed protein product [Rotaria sp. Silwood2]CAF3009775.1 unnamed protein product [Rotaria sp. Silwood2]